MKICFVTEHFPPHVGGVETMFKEYSVGLAKAGCEVKVVTSDSGGVTGRSLLDGVEVHHFPWRDLFGHPVPARKDLQEVTRWSDIVHTTTYTAAPVALSVARQFKKPCVVTVNEVLGRRWFWIEENIVKAALFYAFERYVVRKRYSAYHTISLATERDLLSIGTKESSVLTIYPGVHSSSRSLVEDTVTQSVLDAGASRAFLYFGRPGKTKGVFLLLQAIEKLKSRLPADIRFHFVLSQEPRRERAKFIRLVDERELTDRVRIHDPLTKHDLLRALDEAFCVIVPSLTEGFGFTTAEACQFGKPIIVSDAGSLPEVAFGKVLSFQNRNSDDLANKILMALENRFTSIPAKQFEWSHSTMSLLRMYEQLLNGESLVLSRSGSVR